MISTTQAATILDCHPCTVWRMARDGRIPSIKVGNRRRFDELAVMIWKARRDAEQRG